MRKYIDMNSPVDMLLDMYYRLSPEDAIQALDKLTIMAYDKKLGAENFSEIVYNEETNPKNYAEVVSCSNCKSHNISKNGKDRNGIQRYKCKGCGHTFSATSNTLSSHTSQSVGQWMSFIIGLFNCEKCETLSKKCGISIPTAHEWRLKVFAALEHLEKDVKLTKVIMADDTRLPYSFKGNHREDFYAPRKSHNRGNQNTRKISNDNTVCILCAVDSEGHSFSRLIGFGNPSGRRISEGFKDKLDVTEDTILVTDGAPCFSQTVKDYSIPCWNRKTALKYGSKKYPNIIGELHIQGVNSYHSRLKQFISRFRGVASRYLPGYIMLFDYMENNKHMSQEDMAKKIIDAMTKVSTDITIEDLEAKFRTPVSNGPETELWEKRVPKKEQKIYIDYCIGMSIKEICEKHKITRRKLYYIKEKVKKYDLHNKIMSQKKERKQRELLPISEKSWNIFLRCYRDGESYASVARDYGISRQSVQVTVTNISKRPEATTVKKFVGKPKPKMQAFDKNALFLDFKNMYTGDSRVRELYQMLSVKYGKTPVAVERMLVSYREKNNLIKPNFKWKEERKTMAPAQFAVFRKKRNKEVCDMINILLKCLPNKSMKEIVESVAKKYSLSCAQITKIYYDAYPQNFKERMESRKRFVCRAINSLKRHHPEKTLKEIYEMVAEHTKLSASCVMRIYYEQQKLTQQGHNQAQEQTDEAC